MVKKAWSLIFGLLLLTSVGLAQEEHRYDVAGTVGPVINKSSSGNGTEQTPTNSGLVLATGRMRLNKKVSFEVNVSRTKLSQLYFSAPFNYRIQGPITEFGGAAVYTFIHKEKLEVFALGGMSALVFTPKVTVIDGSAASLPASSQTKPAPVYGLGLDYRVYRNFAVRLQYRGLFYKAPDFNVPNLFTGAYGHMAEPTIGVVYQFK
jgi:opacity protein-like surface antigen